eukprot:3211647-Amphidinium_carterae.1
MAHGAVALRPVLALAAELHADLEAGKQLSDGFTSWCAQSQQHWASLSDFKACPTSLLLCASAKKILLLPAAPPPMWHVSHVSENPVKRLGLGGSSQLKGQAAATSGSDRGSAATSK